MVDKNKRLNGLNPQSETLGKDTLCGERDCKVKRKRYSRKFQWMAVERMKNSENVGDLATAVHGHNQCESQFGRLPDELQVAKLTSPTTNQKVGSSNLSARRLTCGRIQRAV